MSMVTMMRRAASLLAAAVVGLALPLWGQEGSTGTKQTPAAQEEPQSSQATSEKPEKKVQPPTVVPVKTPPESPTPPKNLHKVGDHWTPYTPPDPESFPEGAQIHIIVKRDTLWDLAGAHFQNPYLWPQIWNENQYILDSHWIYPGDPVLLPPRPTVVTEIVPAEGQTAPPPEAPMEEPGEGDEPAPTEAAPAPWQGEMAPSESSGPSMAADYSEIYCSGEIRADHDKTKLYIANAEQEGKIGLTTGDLVYINGGREGNQVQAGETLMIVAREGEVFHPLTDKWLGTYVKRMGKVKVLAVQEKTAIAQIAEACGDRILVGFELEPEREIAVPETRESTLNRLDVEPTGKANGYVVHLPDKVRFAATGRIVDIDLGAKDGLKPGDLLLVFVNNVPPVDRKVTYHYKWNNQRHESEHLRTDDSHLPFPRKPVAELIVLTTREKTSTTKIISSIREVELGNRVELR